MRGFPEVVPRGRLGPVDTGTPFGDVEIELEDPFFRKMVFERTGDQRFTGLPEDRPFRGEIEILRQLLSDRAAAAFEFAFFEVIEGGVLHAFPIESLVREKPVSYTHLR